MRIALLLNFLLLPEVTFVFYLLHLELLLAVLVVKVLVLGELWGYLDTYFNSPVECCID
jgi:hypothetical protein